MTICRRWKSREAVTAWVGTEEVQGPPTLHLKRVLEPGQSEPHLTALWSAHEWTLRCHAWQGDIPRGAAGHEGTARMALSALGVWVISLAAGCDGGAPAPCLCCGSGGPSPLRYPVPSRDGAGRGQAGHPRGPRELFATG